MVGPILLVILAREIRGHWKFTWGAYKFAGDLDFLETAKIS